MSILQEKFYEKMIYCLSLKEERNHDCLKEQVFKKGPVEVSGRSLREQKGFLQPEVPEEDFNEIKMINK
jgi:hypothetical protein